MARQFTHYAASRLGGGRYRDHHRASPVWSGRHQIRGAFTLPRHPHDQPYCGLDARPRFAVDTTEGLSAPLWTPSIMRRLNRAMLAHGGNKFQAILRVLF